jgi:hypothetical protein
MNMKNLKKISVCGLICTDCDIYKAQSNPKIAKNLVIRFNGMWENARAEDFHCGGCRGPENERWSPDCWIRECCVQNKNLQYCYECSDFPCQKLQEWSDQGKRYKEALNRLKNLKD